VSKSAITCRIRCPVTKVEAAIAPYLPSVKTSRLLVTYPHVPDLDYFRFADDTLGMRGVRVYTRTEL
jgi:hypothetical protein